MQPEWPYDLHYPGLFTRPMTKQERLNAASQLQSFGVASDAVERLWSNVVLQINLKYLDQFRHEYATKTQFQQFLGIVNMMSIKSDRFATVIDDAEEPVSSIKPNPFRRPPQSIFGSKTGSAITTPSPQTFLTPASPLGTSSKAGFQPLGETRGLYVTQPAFESSTAMKGPRAVRQLPISAGG